MHSKVLLVVLGLAALAAADSRERYSYTVPRADSGSDESYESSSEESYESSSDESYESSSDESYESSEAKYNFNYAVSDDSSSNEFGHQETRDGDNTQGSYYVQLPDGRLQTVKYYVDGDSGYVAEVSYEGEAQYPESYESYESNESSESNESFETPRYAPPQARYYDSNESK